MTYDPLLKTRQWRTPNFIERVFKLENGEWRHEYYFPYGGWSYRDFKRWEDAIHNVDLVAEYRYFA